MSRNVIAADAALIAERVNLQPLSGRTVLITGASGLLGTYFLAVLAQLKASGVKVEAVAQVRSTPPAHTLEIIERSGFRLIHADLAEDGAVFQLPMADAIIHSAGYAQPLVFMENPAATFQLNTTATVALLRRLREGGAFLFLSSTEVYNGLAGRRVTESDIGTTGPGHPRACYIEGKRGGETICHAFRSTGIRAVAARLAMTYGPGTRPGDKRAMNSFIEQALVRGRIDLMDAGLAFRTYCYVSDAVEMMFQALLYGTQPIYNIAGHSLVTIAELANIIGRFTGAPVSYPENPVEVRGAPDEVRVDVTRAEEEFRKTEFVSLETGLRATIDWQRNLYRA